MIPNIVITLHVVAGHLVPTHVMTTAAMHKMLTARPVVTGTYISYAPFLLTAILDGVIIVSVITVARAFTRLWKRTA